MPTRLRHLAGQFPRYPDRPKANDADSAISWRKIRQRVKDQAVAEKLIPGNHGFGTRRVPLETKILRGLQPAQRPSGGHQGNPDRADHAAGHQDQRCAEYEFDIIIYATGFDAITGSFDRIDFRGVDGLRLKDKWKAGRDLSRRHGRGFPQHDDADGTAYRAGQYSAQHRIQRRLGHRPDAPRAGP
jgi:cation diffusion facilitator CzcD-associated flavoprotein CzcO